jgi:tetratricopeptide (TPR) repeat protein
MNEPIHRSIHLKEAGRFDEALAALDEAIRAGDDLPRAYYQRALTLDAMRRTDDAIEAYRKAIELRPDYLKALVNLAGIYMARQDAETAGKLLAVAAPLAGDADPVFLTHRAMYRRMTGDARGAIADAKRGVEVAPELAGTWVELGQCLLLDPRGAKDSIAANRRALELDPSNARAAHNLAATLDNTGEHAAALPYAVAAHEAAPDDMTYTQTHACVLLHLDRAPDAMPLLERVERARPEHFEAQYNLACGLAKTGQTERAIEHVRRAIELVPPKHRAAFLAHVPNDPDLASLRGHHAFDELARRR